MQNVMEFEVVTELLGLDVRDEKRNRILLGAVSEAVCQYLDRNLLFGSRTDRLIVYDGTNFTPEEYPVRKIESLVEEYTGKQLSLAPFVTLADVSRPDAHRQKLLQLDRPCAGPLVITYQYGYEPKEIPQLIQATILEMLSDRILMYGKPPDYDHSTMDKDRLMNIAPYRRMFYR
jgi:hypothetical protein